MKRRRPKNRRGVLLLVILGLLTMFGLLAITFVIVAGHHQSTAEVEESIDQQLSRPSEDLDNAFRTFLRGTTKRGVPFYTDCLMSDIYGSNSVQASLIPHPGSGQFAIPIAGGQLLEIRVDPTVFSDDPAVLRNADLSQSPPTPLRYSLQDRVGCVLTMTSGPARGLGSRIMAHRRDPMSGIHYFHILAFEATEIGPSGEVFVAGSPLSGNYLVNGTPFSGAGAGFNPFSGELDASYFSDSTNAPSVPLALLPRPFLNGEEYHVWLNEIWRAGLDKTLGTSDDRVVEYWNNTNSKMDVLPPPEAHNEDYDAPDFQTPFLAETLGFEASYINRTNLTPLQERLFPSLPPGTTVTPSMHPTAVINYWYHRLFENPIQLGDPNEYSGFSPSLMMGFSWPNGMSDEQKWQAILTPFGPNRMPGGGDDPCTWDIAKKINRLKRKLMFRPLAEDHWDFDGTNPASREVSETLASGGGLSQCWERGDLDIYIDPGTGNPLFDPAGNQLYASRPAWDVDNDLDGFTDSVWLDLGFPIQTTSDGRKYKPLFAFLVRDMDGCLNLNVDGCLAQTYEDYYAPSFVPSFTSSDITVPPSPLFLFADANNQGFDNANLPLSQGYGAQDINLIPLFDTPLFPTISDKCAEYEKLLAGRYGARLNPSNPPRFLNLGPGVSDPSLSLTLRDDMLSQNKLDRLWNTATDAHYNNLIGLPRNQYDYWQFFNPQDPFGFNGSPLHGANGYGTPPDFNAEGCVGLDLLGHPIYIRMGDQNDYVDEPRELNVYRNSTRMLDSSSRSDKSYTPAELERILRQHDADSRTLPDRLVSIVPTLQDRRLEVTTESSDLPCPSVSVPAHMITALRRLNCLDFSNNSTANRTDLSKLIINLRWFPARHTQHLVGLSIFLAHEDSTQPMSNPGRTPQQLSLLFNESVGHLLAPEVRAGLKMNLNRPIGNSIDDNQNGIVDEPGRVIRNGNLFVLDPDFPGEIVTSTHREQLAQVDANGNPIQGAFLDHVNGIDVNGDRVVNDADRAMARQLYARYMYVLAMMTIDLERHDALMPGTNAIERRKATAKRIAQWAVNVVDFRDRDLISTPFEYDIYPFLDLNTTDGINKTWNIDGFIEDPNSPHPTSDDHKQWRGLVWGCERPELLLTETLAFHSILTQDGEEGYYFEKPDDPSKKDNDFDSKFRPKGTLFFELFNPQSVFEPKSCDLNNAYNGGVDLTRVVLHSDGTTEKTSPVWRVGVYKQNSATDLEYTVHDRSIYFVDADQTNGFNIPTNQDALQHFPSNPQTTIIRPGRYAVIGPGDQDQVAGGQTTTYIGLHKRGGNTGGNSTSTRHLVLPDGSPSNPEFDVIFNRNAGKANGDLAAFTKAGKIDPPVCIAIDKANVISGNQAATKNLRLSISEPKEGYPTADTDGNPFIQTSQEYEKAFDTQLDEKLADPNWGPGGQSSWEVLHTEGTHIAVRVACLERLANPTLPWNKTSNPYIQIDSLVVDLTTFNGAPPADEKRSSPDPFVEPAGFTEGFYSRERGDGHGYRDGGGDGDYGENNLSRHKNNLWPQQPRDINYTPKPNEGLTLKGPPQVHDECLEHTLGYLNWELTGLNPVQGPRDDPDSRGLYRGGAWDEPFPWLTWNNRPYISELELMLVPMPSSAMLLRNPLDFTAGSPEDPVDPVDPEDPFEFRFNAVNTLPSSFNLENAGFSTVLYDRLDFPFQHLPNFFASDESWADPSNSHSNPNPENSLQLHRLLEYVHVPSRFVGTEIQCNPIAFVSPDISGNSTGYHTYNTPFHMISTYREPGRINLNTTRSEDVFRGLMNLDSDRNITGIAEIWGNFQKSLRAWKGNPTGDDPTVLTWNNQSPTRIESPFRSAGGGYLVPPLPAPYLGGLRPEREVNVSVLRRDPMNVGQPLFDCQTDEPYNNAERSPYFRYQRLQRLGNLTTTRSNVYSVWVTVGYFEVRRIDRSERPDLLLSPDPNFDEFAAIYPDGHTLMGELGSDTGDIKRHRAFYLIDRSIPVGFVRGRDYNVKNTVLLERFIE